MGNRELGLLLVATGVIGVVIGLIAYWGGLSWFGRLPGDIRHESGNVRVYVPITTMIVVSVAVSAALFLIRRF